VVNYNVIPIKINYFIHRCLNVLWGILHISCVNIKNVSLILASHKTKSNIFFQNEDLST